MTELALDTALTAEQRQYLELVKVSAESLRTVINDILDFSKIEAGKLDPESVDFDIHETLGDTMKALAIRAHKKGLELSCRIAPDVPEGVVGDPGRLRQVVVNLVGNAIKFTEEGEVTVDVALESKTEYEARLHVTVTDTGTGIPRARQGVIFEAFAQANSSTTREFGGTGLGLTISSKLVAMMDGRIWVESEPDRGSKSHFTARFGVGAGTDRGRDHHEPADLHGLPVRIVDDNATNRLILEEVLTKWQMKPIAVAGVEQALTAMMRAAAEGHPFALVLSDAVMPGMDGFAMVEQIRLHPELARATIMMLSSADHAKDLARCRSSGISSYLVKPIKPSELLDAIVTVLNTPAAKEKEEPTGPAARPRRKEGHGTPSRPLRILVAEDNPVNQTLAVVLLEKHGHSVVVAGNGKEALDALDRQPFDLILMDAQMPEMDGFEATARVREKEKARGGRHTPIIATTAHAIKGDRARCLSAGMDGYVSKPIDADELAEAIARHAPAAAPAPAADVDIEERVRYPLKRVGGKVENLKKIARVFETESTRSLQEIRAAASRDGPRLWRAAHSFKGAVALFGVADASDSTRALEMMGRTDDFTAAREALDDLERAMAGVNDLVATILRL